VGAEQDEPVGMLVDPGCDRREVRHEHGRLRHEMIGGKDGDSRGGILPRDPMNWKEDSGGGASVGWLDQHARGFRSCPLLGEIWGMTAQGDHRGPD